MSLCCGWGDDAAGVLFARVAVGNERNKRDPAYIRPLCGRKRGQARRARNRGLR